MLRKTMVVLAALLAVGLGQMLSDGPVSVPNQGHRVAPGPIPGFHTDGTDAGYILQPIVAGGNGYMYGPAGYGVYSMGFKFTPLMSGNITAIGRYRGSYNEASTVKLWRASDGAQLASASVTGTDWSYVSITPVPVDAGAEYYISTYGGSNVYYYAINSVPFDMNDIRLLNGAYYYGDGMPNSNAGTYIYGCADFYFEPVPATETWTGAVSSDWNTPGNWDGNNVPVLGINAIIPAGCPNYPTSNGGATYGCKTLTLAAGASLTIVAGKPLTCQNTLTNAGTITANANVNCAKLDNAAAGALTINPGVTLTSTGDVTNAGTLTNNGNIYCPKDFTNTGSFTSGTYSEFHFNGSADASFAAGTTDGSGFYHLFIQKAPVAAVFGGDPEAGYDWYFGPADMTLMASNPSTVEGDVSRWSCFNYWSDGMQIQAKIMRANYNGYEWGVVCQGAVQNSNYGLNVYNENLPGVQVGDRIAAYDGGIIPFLGEGGMLIYYGDVTVGANGWYDWGYGPLALRGEIAIPAGDVTSTGNVGILGDLNIASDNELNVSGSGAYTVSGAWINNGSFNPGAGTVTFVDESQMSGTATHTLNNVGITGKLFAPSALTVNGNWDCTGDFDHTNGTVTLKGSSIKSNGKAFYNLTINNATDGNVTLLDNTTVARNLTLTNGTFNVGVNTLTLGTTGASGTAVVNGPAVFSVVGTGSTAKGTVTAAAANRPYAFTVNNGAGLAAKYANFTWMGANGIDIKSGATINPTNNLSWTTFTAGNSAGTMVKIANAQTINDIVHTDFIATAGYNIDYANGTGHLLVTDGTGARWGEDFDNDPANLVDWATSTLHDVGVSAILSPAGTVGEHMIVFPKVTVRNYGEAAETFDVRVIITDANDAEVFNHVEQVAGLGIGATQNFTFTVNSWDPTPKAPFHVLAQSELAGDFNAANDKVEQDFVVGAAYTPGWHAKPNVPGAEVKDGGAMAYNADNGLIYEMKGNKTLEFKSYSAPDSTWAALAPIPAGTKPVKGGASMATGAGKVFVTKGNNTLEFYRYDIAAGVWMPTSKTVPVGAGKKVKAGGSMAFVSKTEGPFVYMLKGYGTEFYKYDVTYDSFTPLAAAPAGSKPKYDKGSWIAYDGEQYLYVNKAKYGEFYRYDVLAEAWDPTALTAMPLVNPSTGKSKKVGDGSAAAFGGGALYALKGNNVTAFWKFTPGTGTWAEKETVPQVAHTGDKKKKVKAGAAIVYHPDQGVFYAQKGNKSNQFWQYGPSSLVMAGERPTRDGVAAGSVTNVALSMAVSPNPLATGYATLRYSLPKSGVVTLNVYDVTGRSVVTRTISAGRTGSTGLDLRNLSAGVYLVKLSSDSFSTSQKLVVER